MDQRLLGLHFGKELHPLAKLGVAAIDPDQQHNGNQQHQ